MSSLLGKSVALILPSTFVVPADAYVYGQPIFQVPLLVRRLRDWLRAQGARVTYIEAPFDEERLLILRGQRTRGPRSKQPDSVGVACLGLTVPTLRARLEQGAPYDELWVTSQFTFDREPIREVVRVAKQLFPTVPVRLGGVYASLCPEDALACGADKVHQGLLFEAENLTWAADGRLGLSILGRGCSRNCSYCGFRSTENTPPYHRKAVAVLADLERLAERDTTVNSLMVTNLFHPNDVDEAELLFAELAQRNERFVLTTGLEPRALTARRASLLQQAGVVEISIALQTLSKSLTDDWQREVGAKEYLTALALLRDAGFASTQLYTDVLTGHPHQSLEEAIRTACFVWSQGVSPLQHAYALVPRSRDGQTYRELLGGLSLEHLHPGLWPCAGPEYAARDYAEYFKLARVLPQMLLRALESVDPDSPVRSLVFRYLDQFHFAIPQWSPKAKLPELQGLQPFLSHPWELALVLAAQGALDSLAELMPHCWTTPVADARYFEVALAWLQANDLPRALDTLQVLLPALVRRHREPVRGALRVEADGSHIRSVVAQALRASGLPQAASQWEQPGPVG